VGTATALDNQIPILITAAQKPSINTMPWLTILSKYAAGQSLVIMTNILIGVVLLRVLSIEEFALYTLSVVFLQIAAGGSDMGLSQAIMTLGARIREQHREIGSLYSSASWHAKKLYVLTALAVTTVFLFNVFDRDWAPTNALACLALLLLIVPVQLNVTFRKSILNINHDARALFFTGMLESVTRLLLLPLCIKWPYAAVAIFANLIGAYSSRRVVIHLSKHKMEEHQPVTEQQVYALKRFINPLIPVVIYNLVQGQISIFILGIHGYTASIAQVGALGRLGQFIAIPMMLNGFLIQPAFSRIDTKVKFMRKAVLVSGSLMIFASVSMASVFVVPQWWLFILGSKYNNLEHELPVAVLTGILTLLGATFYTMVISRNITQGQSWHIAAGILGQVMFLWICGIHSTVDALLLSLIPVFGYCVVQTILLGLVIIRWRQEPGFPVALKTVASAL